MVSGVGRRPLWWRVLGAGALILTVWGIVLVGHRAHAAYIAVTAPDDERYLQVATDADYPRWKTMAAGDAMDWFVRADLHKSAETGSPAKLRGDLALELRSSQPLVTKSGMQVSVTGCTEDFAPKTDAACPGEAQQILTNEPLTGVSSDATGQRFELAPITTKTPRYLHVRFALPADAAITEGDTARLGVGIFASGDDAIAHEPTNIKDAASSPGQDSLPDDGLPVTGADVFALSVLALGLLLTGVALRYRRRA